MPLFVFRCDDCGIEEEYLQSYNSPHPNCESCGDVMVKLIKPSNFQLVGGGWERDGYE